MAAPVSSASFSMHSSNLVQAPSNQGPIARLAQVELALCLSYLNPTELAKTQRVAKSFLLERFTNCKPSISPSLSYSDFKSVAQFIGTLKIVQKTKAFVSHLTLTDEFFRAAGLGQLIEVLNLCDKLDSIRLAECMRLPLEVFDAIKAKAVVLKHLDLSGCSQLTNDHLFALGATPNLQTLILSQCYQLQKGMGLAALGPMPNLRVLNLSGSFQLTIPVSNLGPMTHLQTLELDDFPGLTDAYLRALVGQTPNLQGLVVSSDKLTVEGLTKALSRIPHLKVLHLSKSCRFTDEDRLAILAVHPALRITR